MPNEPPHDKRLYVRIKSTDRRGRTSGFDAGLSIRGRTVAFVESMGRQWPFERRVYENVLSKLAEWVIERRSATPGYSKGPIRRAPSLLLGAFPPGGESLMSMRKARSRGL